MFHDKLCHLLQFSIYCIPDLSSSLFVEQGHYMGIRCFHRISSCYASYVFCNHNNAKSDNEKFDWRLQERDKICEQSVLCFLNFISHYMCIFNMSRKH